MVGPGGNWPPPVEASPAMHEWHAVRDTVVRDTARTRLDEDL
jgi:hypothetical protein